MIGILFVAVKQPAQPQTDSFEKSKCGAESDQKKKELSPEVAASTRATL